ncbi:reverse transcriptase domain-containing protein, partial [Tanacetum coccineum]
FMQAYDATNNESPIPLPRALIAPPTVLPSSPVLPLSPIMDPKRISTSAAAPMTQAAIKKLVGDSVFAALKAQAATMANTDNTNKNTDQEKFMCNNTDDCKVKFATGTLTEEALSWWNSFAQRIGIEQDDKIAWTELKRLLINKYFPRTEVRKMDDDFYDLVVKGNDLKTYARRFQELATFMSKHDAK